MGLHSTLNINVTRELHLLFGHIWDAIRILPYPCILNDGDAWRSQSRFTIYGVICSQQRLCDREEDIWWSRGWQGFPRNVVGNRESRTGIQLLHWISAEVSRNVYPEKISCPFTRIDIFIIDICKIWSLDRKWIVYF